MLLYLKIRGRYKSLSSERRRLNFYRFFQDELLIGGMERYIITITIITEKVLLQYSVTGRDL